MNEPTDTAPLSAYTLTHTSPLTRDILAIQFTAPAGQILAELTRLVRAELEGAYRAGQASSPAERHDALTAKLEAERVLLRRAIGIVSDLSRLEGEIRDVLDAHARDADKATADPECRHERTVIAGRLDRGEHMRWCRDCGALGEISMLPVQWARPWRRRP